MGAHRNRLFLSYRWPVARNLALRHFRYILNYNAPIQERHRVPHFRELESGLGVRSLAQSAAVI
jgi:hypothetical protein